ncbi:hypothetical protein COU79_03165 [Candidatus Peregrinibacteria bacterium CG10_big_fil_rev_8_21_14_0_10_54_7]|nr:MAG: hypothetical protein COU79_03165 [Candidatus Peregrinibacteria bacterium CG10_big_fil_rev_8_21_14_0_10_54_7]
MPKGLNFQRKSDIVKRLGIEPKVLEEILYDKEKLFYVEEEIIKGKTRDFHKCRGSLYGFLPQLNKAIMSLDALPPELCGGVRGKSIFKSASQHQKKKFVLKLDLKDFFHSVKPYQVQAVFERLGCTPSMSKLLTYTCTANNHLPQGFSTSPILAAHVLAPFVEDMRALLRPHHLSFTIWVDDITISGYTNPVRLLPTIRSICKKHKVHLNEKKRKLLRAGKQTQEVTGVRISYDKLSTGATFFRDTERMVYVLKKFGWHEVKKKFAFNVTDKRKVIQKIKGRINHIRQANAHQAGKLDTALRDTLEVQAH